MVSQVLYVFPQLAVEGMAAEGGAVAEDDELHSGTGDGHVHAAKVAQEADLALIVAAHKGDDDDVALLPLEAIDGVHGDEAAEWLEKLILLHKLAQQLHLSTVGRYDAHIEPLAQDALLAYYLEIGS